MRIVFNKTTLEVQEAPQTKVSIPFSHNLSEPTKLWEEKSIQKKLLGEILPPLSPTLANILPNEPLLLMGAGPVPIPHAVALANSTVIDHLGETMNRVIQGIKYMAKYVFQTESDKVIGIAGSASAAMEMAVANLLWPGRKVLVLKKGTFSNRFAEMAQTVGADVTILEAPLASPITINMVREELKKQRYDVVTMVQGETSCGVLTTELPDIVSLAKQYGSLVIVDAVCTLTTIPLMMDEWKLDAVVSGGQKGLSTIPGVSLVSFSEEAWRTIENRSTPQSHWCLDAVRAQKFWGDHQYHYTAPVPGILALYEAFRLVCEETLEKRFERHYLSSKALQAGVETMGLELFIPPEYRLNCVIAIKVPDGVNAEQVRKFMAEKFHVQISGAFGHDIVRVGQMGEQCRSHNLFKVLYALGMGFRHEGIKLDIAAGMAALEKNLVLDFEHFVD